MQRAGQAMLAWRRIMGSRLRIAALLPVLVVLCLGFGLGEATFFTGANTAIVLQQAALTTVLATGMTVVILTGGIDLSVGSTLAASATAAVVVSFVPYLGMLGIVAGLAVGLLLGCVNGWVITALRLPPVLVTLTAFAVVRTLARLLGGDSPISNPRLPFAVIGNRGIVGVPLLVFIALGVVSVAWFILRRTALGARIRAAGDPDAARLSDAESCRVLMVAYASSGLLAGFGGVMSAARLFAANTAPAGQSYTLDAIAAVILGGILGGAGSVWGTVVGALAIAVLADGLVLSGISDTWQVVVKVLVIIGVLAFDHDRLDRAVRG